MSKPKLRRVPENVYDGFLVKLTIDRVRLDLRRSYELSEEEKKARPKSDLEFQRAVIKRIQNSGIFALLNPDYVQIDIHHVESGVLVSQVTVTPPEPKPKVKKKTKVVLAPARSPMERRVPKGNRPNAL